METACSWLFDTLDTRDAYPLQLVYERHVEPSDSFDLSDVLSFLPEKDLPKLAGLIQQRLSPTLSYLKTEPPENDITDAHSATVRAASEMAWLLVSERKAATPSLHPLIYALHDAFLELPSDSHNRVSTLCEKVWHNADPERNRVVPCTMLYLLQRSFGEESGARCTTNRGRLPGTVAHIHRVYAMRKSLETLELSETSPESETIRNLLMRCATSSAYLKTPEGRKFLAYLLTLKDVKASTFDALTNHLAAVRKSSANFFGMVFLIAWKSKREEWLAERLMSLSEKAIQAGSEPFSTNLRVVLSTFHANKRVTGVDLLLNDIYSPVLFRNLMVANPLVRRNAAIVLSDAFPIHDPGAGVQEIERTIEFQCAKLLDLLQDPCCPVRLAAIEGSCRILGLFWELVSSTYAKRVIDLLTSRMAFDTSSPLIRMTVFEGLEFLIENHLSHQVLAIALPRLGSLVHDRVERVRLSFLDLLLTVKRKRIVSLRYFDVVGIQDLLLRLPKESPAVAAKIMALIRTSYFPLESKQKTVEELAASQTRACLSMLNSNLEAAQHFYRQLYLHAPPGPLLEFAMRLSHIAMNAPVLPTAAAVKTQKRRQKNSHSNKNTNFVLKPREGALCIGSDENVPPPNGLTEKPADRNNSNSSSDKSVDRESILMTVSDVFVSISTSLHKEANKDLQTYFESIFGGDALRMLVLEKRNSLGTRVAGWRIASCLSVSQVEPLIVLWKKQMSAISEWDTRMSSDLGVYRDLVSALLLCGLKWNLESALSSFFGSWCDGSVNGSRATGMGIKASKRNRSRNKTKTDELRYAVNAKHDIATRAKFLFSLWVCGYAILTSEDLHEGFLRMIITSGQDPERGDNSCVLAPLRQACTGVLDFFLEKHSKSGEEVDIEVWLRPRFLLRAVTTTWRVCLKFATCETDGQRPLEEIRLLTQWFSSSHVWKSAFAINDRFGIALASICLAHCADTVAVTQLSNEDLVRYEEILNCILHEMVYSNTREADQLIAEALRLSFLLREQAFDTEACTSAADLCGPLKLRNTSNVLLSVVCEFLSSVQLPHDPRSTGLPKTTRHEDFLRDIIIDMNNAEHTEDFRPAFSKSLVVGFQTESMAENGLFSSLICKIVVSMIISKQKSGPGLGFKLYTSIVRCFRDLEDRVTADQCIGNFTKVLVDSLFSHYDENNNQTKPGEGAKECFANMDSVLEKEFPHLSLAQEQEETSDFVVREARKVIVLLRNMGERDAEENKEESRSTGS